MIKIKLSEALQAYQAVQKFLELPSSPDVPVSTLFYFVTLQRELKSFAEDFEKTKNKLEEDMGITKERAELENFIREHGTPTDKGGISMLPDNPKFAEYSSKVDSVVNSDNHKELVEKLNTAIEQVVTVKAKPIQIKDLNGAVGVTGRDLQSISAFIKP